MKRFMMVLIIMLSFFSLPIATLFGIRSMSSPATSELIDIFVIELFAKPQQPMRQYSAQENAEFFYGLITGE